MHSITKRLQFDFLSFLFCFLKIDSLSSLGDKYDDGLEIDSKLGYQ